MYVMDPNVYWQRLGVRKNLNAAKVQKALAVFADNYSKAKEEIIEYKHFKEL